MKNIELLEAVALENISSDDMKSAVTAILKDYENAEDKEKFVKVSKGSIDKIVGMLTNYFPEALPTKKKTASKPNKTVSTPKGVDTKPKQKHQKAATRPKAAVPPTVDVLRMLLLHSIENLHETDALAEGNELHETLVVAARFKLEDIAEVNDDEKFVAELGTEVADQLLDMYEFTDATLKAKMLEIFEGLHVAVKGVVKNPSEKKGAVDKTKSYALKQLSELSKQLKMFKPSFE